MGHAADSVIEGAFFSTVRLFVRTCVPHLHEGEIAGMVFTIPRDLDDETISMGRLAREHPDARSDLDGSETAA